GQLTVGHVLGPCHRHPLVHRVPPPPPFALTLDVSPRGYAWNSSVADCRPDESERGGPRPAIGRDCRPSAEETVSAPRARSPRHLRGVGIDAVGGHDRGCVAHGPCLPAGDDALT